MFRWLRERQRQYKFTKAFKQSAKHHYSEGMISAKEYAQCLEACDNKEGMSRAYRQMTADPNMLGGIKDWDWEAIYAWFITYFIPVMKIIIPIIISLQPAPEDE